MTHGRQHPADLACVEVGGGSIQTVLFTGEDYRVTEGAVCPPGATLLVAAPGLIEGRRVLAASNLGWYDVDPAEVLGLEVRASLLLNDGEAAALGEAALRGDAGLAGLSYVGLGTGVGGAVVRDGRVVAANLFGHTPGFGDIPCTCTAAGCLETVAAGWALPTPLTDTDVAGLAAALASAVEREPVAAGTPVVVGGGLARRYPAVVAQLGRALPDRVVTGSAAPAAAKSAAAWGLRHAASTEQEAVA